MTTNSSGAVMQLKPILRIAEVSALIGVKVSTIKYWVKRGVFPRPVKLGGSGARLNGWRAQDLNEWLASRQAA